MAKERKIGLGGEASSDGDAVAKAARAAVRLGASLYMPCTRKDLGELVRGAGKAKGLRSVIFCLEDAVRSDEFEQAFENFASALADSGPGEDASKPMRFVRARDPDCARRLLGCQGIGRIDGFVLPKVDSMTFPSYAEIFAGYDGWLMPTLETAETFDDAKMRDLRDRALSAGWGRKVLSWRIGGNDLMNLLGVRRSRVRTIYQSPLGGTLGMLSSVFRPCGFNLSAPVFELLDHRELLALEVPQDLEHGFMGKTAIHPDQVPAIEAHYRVFSDDLRSARMILAADAPAVFKCGGAMCEPKTHERWAESILARAEVYGVVGA